MSKETLYDIGNLVPKLYHDEEGKQILEKFVAYSMSKHFTSNKYQRNDKVIGRIRSANKQSKVYVCHDTPNFFIVDVF